MANPKFSKSGYSDLEFGRGLLYPVEKPQHKIQVVERTAGGSLQVESLGVTIHTRPLRARGLSSTFFTNLRTWHDTVANGAVNTFTYTDEDETAHTVRWLDDTLNMPEYFNARYSVEILLEVISTP